MSNYVFVPPLDGSGLTLDALRTTVIADARARYRRARGDTVTYAAALTGGDGRTRDQLARLDVSVTETPALDRDRLSDLYGVLTPAAAMGDALLARFPKAGVSWHAARLP